MKAIAETMGVSRTHQYEKRMNNRQDGKRFYHKTLDNQYLPLIRKIVDDRATYGYRRVTALLWQEGWKISPSRVERIWKQEGLKVPQKQPKRG